MSETFDSIAQILSGAAGSGAIVGYWLWRTLNDNKGLQDKLDACTAARLLEREANAAARLADREAQTKRMEMELNAQRDALEAAAGAGRDQADALDAVSKNVAELRADLKDLAKEVATLRAAKGGGR